jgi:hypothetical protein
VRSGAAVATLVAAIALSCSRRTPPQPVTVAPEPEPVAVTPPSIGVDSVLRLVAAHQFSAAESLLTQFAAERADTPDAAEADFWRAVIRSDPANTNADAKSALALLDAYIARGSVMPRYLEATLLKHLFGTSDSLRLVIGSMRQAVDLRERVREDSIAKLNKDLEATKAELERIKTRLTKRP